MYSLSSPRSLTNRTIARSNSVPLTTRVRPGSTPETAGAVKSVPDTKGTFEAILATSTPSRPPSAQLAALASILKGISSFG